jgi:hypothetical protein
MCDERVSRYINLGQNTVSNSAQPSMAGFDENHKDRTAFQKNVHMPEIFSLVCDKMV